MRNPLDFSDEELESCVDGNTSVPLMREILEKHGVVVDGHVQVEVFAQWFAYGIEGFIDADEETDEWEEANDNNYDWGWSIADAINDHIDYDAVCDNCGWACIYEEDTLTNAEGQQCCPECHEPVEQL